MNAQPRQIFAESDATWERVSGMKRSDGRDPERKDKQAWKTREQSKEKHDSKKKRLNLVKSQ